MIFTIRLLGQSNVNENTLFLLQGLFNKSDTILNLLFANPIKETIKILENLKFYMNYLETIFPYKKTKRKKLIRF